MSSGCCFCVRACADSHVWMCLTKKKTHFIFKSLLLPPPLLPFTSVTRGDVTIKGTRSAVTSSNRRGSRLFNSVWLSGNSSVLLLVGHEKIGNHPTDHLYGAVCLRVCGGGISSRSLLLRAQAQIHSKYLLKSSYSRNHEITLSCVVFTDSICFLLHEDASS